METRIAEGASAITNARSEISSRLAELAGELRDSDQQLREEHRVSFKQLSLEATEAAISEDRGRRLIQSRLDELEKGVPNGKG